MTESLYTASALEQMHIISECAFDTADHGVGMTCNHS